jgi:hypothetical protein
MKRGLLRWFYLGVQFVMLAVSIPKVATLFHAYDTQTMGPLIGGVDGRSWLVGIAIDLTATVTTWAALAKYDASRKRTALLAPALIILLCSALSVAANYEDAATLNPAQYAHVSLFTQPALVINPLLISAPPVLVLLLILLVPSVLAQPRLKTAIEIEAETEEQEALIAADARIRKARALANAEVRSTQVAGLASTASAILKQARGEADVEQPSAEAPPKPDIHLLPQVQVTGSAQRRRRPDDAGNPARHRRKNGRAAEHRTDGGLGAGTAAQNPEREDRPDAAGADDGDSGIHTEAD